MISVKKSKTVILIKLVFNAEIETQTMDNFSIE